MSGRSGPGPVGRRRAAASVLLVAALAVVAACGGDQDAPPVAEGSTPAPSQSPTETPLAEEEQAGVDARAALERYRGVFDAAWLDPGSSLDAFDAVASGRLLASVKANLESAREAGRTRTGSTTLDGVVVEHVRIPDEPELPPTVTIAGCVDASKVELFESDGSAVATSGEPRFAVVYELVNPDYPEPTGWRVGTETSEGSAC